MTASARVRFKSFTIDSVSRTAITVLLACKSIILRNSGSADVTLYDADTGGESQRLPGGAEHVLPSERSTAYAEGETVIWAQADSGTGPITVEYRL